LFQARSLGALPWVKTALHQPSSLYNIMLTEGHYIYRDRCDKICVIASWWPTLYALLNERVLANVPVSRPAPRQTGHKPATYRQYIISAIRQHTYT